MATNAEAIKGALPQLIVAEQRLSQLAATKGIRYRIAPFGGVRSQADTTRILEYRDADYTAYVSALQPGQKQIPKEQWRKIAPFGTSYHNYGAAFDIQITTKPQGVTNAQALGIVGSLAEQAGLQWGADFGDEPHFQLRVTLQKASQLWQAAGKTPGIGATPVAVLGVVSIIGLLLFVMLRK